MDGERFAVVMTADGSPTIQDLTHPQREWMHHRGGAYQETQYIYGEAIRAVLARCTHPRFLVVGLGLGYIEILIACEWLKISRADTCRILSFEADEHWRTNFQQWCQGQPTELDAIYQLRDQKFQQDYPQQMRHAPAWLQQFLELHGQLDRLPQWQGQIHGILYDAYSAKTSPDLWQETFLAALIQHYAASPCLFVTYASTGSLKRALTACGFTLHQRAGFAGKKASTWATRGWELQG
ncbi:MAG: MnmC family methyltransferase [Gloeomargarita sp. SKYBB_i_bin120]|nr:MnmC family methyltransferase [Gloeomargarita sp. SKYB120]MDW8179232.1 MnmC family methyltransferase [Gloeomargarita sp. SKYBB_i_bin120]